MNSIINSQRILPKLMEKEGGKVGNGKYDGKSNDL